MKIVWADGVKEVPGYGTLVEGETYEHIPDKVAERLIKAGKAQKVKKSRKKEDN